MAPDWLPLAPIGPGTKYWLENPPAARYVAAMKRMVIAMAVLAACGSGKAKEVCKRASEKYQACVKEKLGPEMAAIAAQKEDIAACVRDDKTVALYTKCNESADCDKFMDCMENEARETAPAIAKGLSRKDACAEHVKSGLRAMAMQEAGIKAMDGGDQKAARDAQSCLGDESKPWESCVTPEIRDSALALGRQRQIDCEGWSEDIAACAFHQKPCDPDTLPLWRDPRPQAPAGPKPAWTVDNVTREIAEPAIAWTAAHDLAIGDDTGLRLVHDGKVAWTLPGKVRDVAVAGNYVVTHFDDVDSVEVIDAKTGAHNTVLAGHPAAHIVAIGDKVIAKVGDNLFEITPSACANPACAKKLGEAKDAEALMLSEDVFARGDKLVWRNSADLIVTDRKGTAAFTLHQPSEGASLAVAGDTIAVSDDTSLAVLSLAACMKLGAKLEVNTPGDVPAPCKIASAEHKTNGDRLYPADGIVIHHNDEKSFAFGANVTWNTATDGRGQVVSDGKLLYMTSLGDDGARVLALDRATGKLIWATQLDKTTKYGSSALAIDGKNLAVWVDKTVYVLAL